LNRKERKIEEDKTERIKATWKGKRHKRNTERTKPLRREEKMKQECPSMVCCPYCFTKTGKLVNININI
jgi:hypothetical protein